LQARCGGLHPAAHSPKQTTSGPLATTRACILGETNEPVLSSQATVERLHLEAIANDAGGSGTSGSGGEDPQRQARLKKDLAKAGMRAMEAEEEALRLRGALATLEEAYMERETAQKRLFEMAEAHAAEQARAPRSPVSAL